MCDARWTTDIRPIATSAISRLVPSKWPEWVKGTRSAFSLNVRIALISSVRMRRSIEQNGLKAAHRCNCTSVGLIEGGLARQPTPEEVRKRMARNKARRHAIVPVKVKVGDGKDVGAIDGLITARSQGKRVSHHALRTRR